MRRLTRKRIKREPRSQRIFIRLTPPEKVLIEDAAFVTRSKSTSDFIRDHIVKISGEVLSAKGEDKTA